MKRRYLSLSFCLTGLALASNMPADKESMTNIAKNTSSELCKTSLYNKWYTTSSEERALYKEIFELSKSALLSNKKQMVKPGQQCGVVFDIDETLLSNSIYEHNNEKHCTSFKPATWTEFVNSEQSKALPGASEITHYVHSIGCKVNLVSGRSINTQKVTEDNLRRENIYFDQVLFSNKLSDTNKNPRFNAIINGQKPSLFGKQAIIAYYGDNIEDFPNSNQSLYFGKSTTDKVFDKFGKEYFVLPNPVYGSWLANKSD